MQLSLFKVIKQFKHVIQAGVDYPRAKRQAFPRSSVRPDPLLQRIWLELRSTFLPGEDSLDDYKVVWSARKQNRTLASCSVSRRRITVARELNHPSLVAQLEPLLYHELCHAYLARFKYLRHGKRFRAIEAKHPRTRDLREWIKAGGWTTAVRRDRARRAYARRQPVNQAYG